MRLANAASILCAALAAVAAAAQSPPPEAAAPPPPCSAPEHRQFDFWIGEWAVTADGRLAGRNRIEPLLEGCALLESWEGASGHRGTSINFYDARRGLWHQTWIDVAGRPLHLEGRFADGRMVLSGTALDPDTGRSMMHRISWMPQGDGSVRQLWESSEDGSTWSVVFDGRYVRSEPAEAAETRERRESE